MVGESSNAGTTSPGEKENQVDDFHGQGGSAFLVAMTSRAVKSAFGASLHLANPSQTSAEISEAHLRVGMDLQAPMPLLAWSHE